MAVSQKKNVVKLGGILLILAVVLCIIISSLGSIVMQTLYPVRYSELVEQNADSFNIEKELLYALIKTESGFDKEAVSSVGAKGLTQITPDTFEWLQTKTGEAYEDDALFEPEISVYYGSFFLDMLLQEFGDTRTALAAYHAGRGIVNQWLADERYSKDGKTLDEIPYGDTAGYVEKVIKTYEKYKKLY